MIARLAGFLLLSTLLAGCGSTSAVERRVDELEQELRDLRRSHAMASQRIRDIDRLNQTTFLLQDSIEQLGLESDRLREADGKREQRLRILEAALFGDGEPSRPAAPAPRAAAPAAPASAGAARPSGRSAADPPAGSDIRTVYSAAYQAMEARQIEAAVAGFERLLAEAPRSDLADNAHYWLGEIFQALGDLDRSERHFRTILDEYPSGNKVPDALYKLGVLAELHGNREAAVPWYRKVISQYPWSPVAEKAAERLGEQLPAP